MKKTSILLVLCLAAMPVFANSEKLTDIIDRAWQHEIDHNPLMSASYGNGDQNHLLPDMSPEYLLAASIQQQAFLDELAAINVESLTQEERINLQLLQYKLQNLVDHFAFNSHYMPLNAEGGFHSNLSFLPSSIKFRAKEDYESYLQRLNAVPAYFEQQMNWMKKGLESGVTQPQAVLVGFEDSISSFIVDKPRESVFFKPFKRFPKKLNLGERDRLIAAADKAISENVVPAYQRFYDFMTKEYMPNSRQTLGASELPNGQAYYQNRVSYFTTLDISAEEVHDIGLGEVKRIKGEMEAIIASLKFEGSFADFLEFLRTDPQFYPKTAEELLKEASYIAKKMDAKLPSLFKTLPRTPYGIEPVPASIAPKYTTGRYSAPRRDDLAGFYWVNTYALDRRPLYVLEALTFHEAVPGHHLQGSLAREMEDVPAFRQAMYISAFGEGWGLYSEYLGVEAGFYQDPYSKFGRLTYEMWRACRLVVDTGLHVKGWTREQAIEYMASRTALSLHNVTTETDRYISWPGQALSYKMGELAIKRIRQQAESELGDLFDIREFHDQILKHGSVPLSVLEAEMNQYIESVKD